MNLCAQINLLTHDVLLKKCTLERISIMVYNISMVLHTYTPTFIFLSFMFRYKISLSQARKSKHKLRIPVKLQPLR